MKTSKAHFEFFKRVCEHYRLEWHLDAWDMHYLHQDVPGCFASINIDLEGHVATVKFSVEWTSTVPLTKERIAETAKHEMAHLLLARIAENGSKRFLSRSEYYEANEEVVAKILNLIPSETFS